MKSAGVSFPESLAEAGGKRQHRYAFKKELLARMIEESAKELSHLATLVQVSEMVRQCEGEKE